MFNLCFVRGYVALIALAALAAPPASVAQTPDTAVPEVRLPWMKRPPVIDGRIDEEEWRGAVRSVGLVSHHTRSAAAREAVFWLGSDGRSLFLAVKSEAPPDGRVLNRALPDGTRDIAAVLLDDTLELVLDPHRGRPAGADRRFYHLISNGRGTLYDWSVDPDNRQNAVDLTWRIPQWQLAQHVIDGYWHVELAIPLASLGIQPDDWQRPWGLQLARNWRRPAEQSQWSSEPASYDDPSAMPVVQWDQAAPVVRVLSVAQQQRPVLRVAVFNPHDAPLTVSLRLSDTWHRDPAVELSQQLTVAAGQEEVVTLEGRDHGPEGLHSSLIHVASPDGSRTYYQRAWRWALQRPEPAWALDEQQQTADLQLKYYPYRQKIAFQANLDATLRPAARGTMTLWKADAAGKPAGQPLWQQAVELAGERVERVESIPDLPAGSYLFGLQVHGRPPTLRPFQRQVFDWEHNNLGLSDEIMPPFTPLEVHGNTVAAVLRQHRHGPAGLWDQVSSDGQPLLAAPMRLEVVTAEKGRPPRCAAVEASGWQAGSTRPNRVEGWATWRAGPIAGRVSTQYDYDGMMLTTLEFGPDAAAPAAELTHLDLAIPLRGDAARYMHAVGDGLRFNYAGHVPAGRGRIWDSRKASKQDIVGTFYPYLWIGDGQRGLCWFADTDRDWILDEQTPTLDLVRQGNVVTLHVHFVTRPGRLDRPHRIVFGLQATPTKPMPAGWRRWTALKRVEPGRSVRWMGACYYWGGDSYDVYPLQQHYEFYDQLREARLTGHDRDFYVSQFMDLIQRRGAPKGSPWYTHWLNHVRAGFQIAKSSPWWQDVRLIPYTNPRGAGFHVPEFATFQDEWLRLRYFSHSWKPEGNVGYDVGPARSFQDYCLWNYRKMLTCFDGVYWDNVFLAANFDPVEGQAWTDDRGRVHPTMGLLQLRELLKRSAVMLWQETREADPHRRPPITLAHMTNALIVPVMSFINCTMDWEWKYGYDDFQDRFAPDLIVAESIGRQVGAWPTSLGGGHWQMKDPRVEPMLRTRLGVTLVHEIQPFDASYVYDATLLRRLFAFGYGDDQTRVYNYWQRRPPVSLAGVDARWLAMAKGGEALVVVTDFGGGGTCRVTLDLAQLGLKPDAQATDFESFGPIERAAAGTFVFSLKKHDFRILQVR